MSDHCSTSSRSSHQGLEQSRLGEYLKSHRVADAYAAESAAHAAARAAEAAVHRSRVIDLREVHCVPQFNRREVVLGNLLGQGSFNDVYEVQSFNAVTPGKRERKFSSMSFATARTSSIRSDIYDSSDEHDEDSPSGKQWYRRSQIINGTEEKAAASKYALKTVSQEAMAEKKQYETAAADLVLEMRLLASLNHPRIVKVHGVSDAGVEAFATGRQGDYFIIIDRLYDTLEERIHLWQKKVRKQRGSVLRKVFGKLDVALRQSLAHRIGVAAHIASALAYLHSLNIVYRDVKPENIGFDAYGQVKLFDFGLARELKPEKEVEKGLYDLTGGAGTRRYMAPEVAMNRPYGLSADVYSFSLLLWQLCSMEKPYDDLDRRAHDELVIRDLNGGHRPPLDENWSPSLRSVIEWGWKADLDDRPTMSSISSILRAEAVSLMEENETNNSRLKKSKSPKSSSARAVAA